MVAAAIALKRVIRHERSGRTFDCIGGGRRLLLQPRFRTKIRADTTDREQGRSDGQQLEVFRQGAKRGSLDEDKLLAQYGVGSSRFAGSPYALYERHLKFDNVVELESSDERERYEAAAHTVETFFRTAGCAQMRPTRGRIRSGSTMFRSSF